MRKRYWLSKVIREPGMGDSFIPSAFVVLEEEHYNNLKSGNMETVGQVGDVVAGSNRVNESGLDKYVVVMTYTSPAIELKLLADGNIPITRSKSRLNLSRNRSKVPLEDRILLSQIKIHYPNILDEEVDE